MRVTKAGTGQMLWLDLEVLEGPLQGRHVYDQLNLINPNPTAEEIAQRTLCAICHAVGKLRVSDSEELHFLPMAGEGRRPAQRLQRGQGLQAGPAGDHR